MSYYNQSTKFDQDISWSNAQARLLESILDDDVVPKLSKPNDRTLELLSKAQKKSLEWNESNELLLELVSYAETLDVDEDMTFQGKCEYGYKVEIGDEPRGFGIDIIWKDDEISCFQYRCGWYSQLAFVSGDEANQLAKRMAKLACKWVAGLSI